MRKLKRGFTLLELMIAISLMMIIMLMLWSMFSNAQHMYLRAAKRIDIYSQARASLDIMEQDLLRMETGTEDYHTLNCRTVMPEDLRNLDGIPTYKGYSRMDDWTDESDAQSLNIHEFLSFTGRNTWYDDTQEKYVTGNALVVYYLRKRLPVNGEDMAGGYLVRRIIPVRSSAEIIAIGQGKVKEPLPIAPHEDELASFVYGARVYADDQAAFQVGVRNGSFNYNIMPECSSTVPNAKWMYIQGSSGIRPSAPQVPQAGPTIRLQMPLSEDRVEFGGFWSTATSQDRDFASARWNYPSVVMIDLLMVDRKFERYSPDSGAGSYRSFSRAVQLPVSGPMFRLDARDLDIVR
ncbi:MAG: prepilin-type N-terminal cleavage/methylation domain-containing protein [Planctomycetes bacterium]|nr:prepilin-type N-terminal cleavage/methylation domain-containing protein [Planctomycetota bacterium]